MAVRQEKWPCGLVTISDGDGIERIDLPHCTVHVATEERAGRQIEHVLVSGRIVYPDEEVADWPHP